MSTASDIFRITGYMPKDLDLFQQALTHSSCGLPYCNERLEFLGDAVLELTASEFLYRTFPDIREGELSRLRSELVCEAALSKWAKDMDIGTLLLLGKGEEMTGGRNKTSILSDAVEAVIAAIYLDGGYEAARALVERILSFLFKLKNEGRLVKDAKTILQELLQKNGGAAPTYELTGESGPPHLRAFTVTAFCRNTVIGIGSGSTKKQAEQEAAKNALEKLKETENMQKKIVRP